MPDKQPPTDSHIVTRGAGMVFLGRMGALLEPISIIVFANLYGAPALGLFMLLWGYVQVSVAGTDMATSVAIQRFIPAAKDDETACAILKASLLISLVLSLLLAAALSLAAPYLAQFINTDARTDKYLSTIIAIYVWTIPVWCLVEVNTAAARARRAFGPEVRIRIFYEQGLRLVAGVAFYFLGFPIFGLFIAHLLGVTLTAAASFRQVHRQYDLKKVWRAPLAKSGFAELIRFGLPMMGTAMLKKFQSNFPAFLLNFIIPGAQGASAVAIYTVARKITSALQGIRMSFEYVIAPIAASRNPLSERDALQDLYAFTTRLVCAIFIPAAALMVALRHDIIAVVGHEFAAAGALVAVLTAGRMAEAFTGPSASLIEMLAKYRLPLLNGLAGFAVIALLMIWLVPAYGAWGAAAASACGMATTAIASVIEAKVIYDLLPYDRRLIQPLAVATLGAAVIAALVAITYPLGMAARIAAGVAGLAVAYFILLRFGFHERDAAAFGRLARWVRN
jgi:O-antigen/teichoic acid export membrane protein